MAQSRWGKLQHLILESVVIVLSVLLALVAEDWRSERATRRDVRQALVALDVEVAANLAELEDFLVVVGERYDRLTDVGVTIDNSRPFSTYVQAFGGYRVPDLDLSAWTRLSSDPAASRVAPERMREAFVLYHGLNIGRSWKEGLDGPRRSGVVRLHGELLLTVDGVAVGRKGRSGDAAASG